MGNKDLIPEEIDPCSLYRIAEFIIYNDIVLAFKYIKIASSKGFEEALYQLANIFITLSNESIPEDVIGKLPNYQNCIETLERNIMLWESEKSYISLGDVYHHLNKIDESIKWYKICSETKGSIIATLKLGGVYNDNNDTNRAIECYESIADKSAMASIQLALLYYPHNLEKVIEYYENALILDPNLDVGDFKIPPLHSLRDTLERKKYPNTISNINSPYIYKTIQKSKKKYKKKRIIKKNIEKNEGRIKNIAKAVALGLGGLLALSLVLHNVVPRESE